MRPIRDLPIQRKLRVVILATCSAALIVACGALFTLQFYFFKRDYFRDLAAVAEIIGNNSSEALFYRDEARARDILTSLRAKPNLTGAALVTLDGRTLAEIGNALLPQVISTPLTAGARVQNGETIYLYPVAFETDPVGTLILHPDYQAQAAELFRVYAAILAAVLAISFLVAALISWRLEKLILFPIKSLADTARTISRRNDYSVRAEKFVEDEVGSFTDSFNIMLDQIETHDQALRHEIAERKRAEQELQHTQERLMAASRLAGMAEVATGVLHNVGNVLNSVNVSATLIADRLHHSKLSNLQRAVMLLRKEEGRMAEFLSNDPKGQVLPGYLLEVVKFLGEEREEALCEVSLLNKNIEHIKDIVARQQNYARVSGVIEPLPLEELIEDAIRMNADSFDRHGVAVTRQIHPIGPAAVDRHKVLQILINLLRNAKNAMGSLPPDRKKLTVSLMQKNDTCAEIRVRDTGVGIVPENLTKVFSHGFTTRSDGHGFGLHASAVAAQQMNGRLSAESAGPNQGATFILELPLADSATAPVTFTTAAA